MESTLTFTLHGNKTNQSYKFKKKISNLRIKKKLNTRHISGSYLIKCVNTKWIWIVLCQIQSRHHFVHWWTDRWTRWNQYTPPEYFNFVEAGFRKVGNPRTPAHYVLWQHMVPLGHNELFSVFTQVEICSISSSILLRCNTPMWIHIESTINLPELTWCVDSLSTHVKLGYSDMDNPRYLYICGPRGMVLRQ